MFKEFQETFSFDDVLLVPQYSEVTSRKNVSLKTTLSAKKKFTLEIPIVSASMDTVTESRMAIALGRLGGLGIIHRFATVSYQVKEVRTAKKAGIMVGAAFGVQDGEFERVKALVKAGADVLNLDIAHGHSTRTIETIKKFKKYFPKKVLIAGTVATSRGFYDLAKAGADVIKVGIGAGSVCTTRIVTGFGVPQLSAVLDCAPVARKMKVGLISDASIRSSGDIVKALAAGADAVMFGNLLSGTDEAPGRIIKRGHKKFKVYRGEASFANNLERPDKKMKREEIIVEGISALVPYKGSVKDVLNELLGGLKSGLSYGGAHNLRELQKKAVFIRITPSAVKESGSHDVYLE